MENYLKASDIKEQVPLVGLLARLGYQPVRRSRKETYYVSMLRDSDTTPSFCVNDELGTWYDHGMGRGGNVVDFGIAYWPGLKFSEVLNKIRQTADREIIPSGSGTERTSRRRHAIKVPHYKVEEVKDLGNSPAITAYLQSRGIWEEAQGRIKEIYYYVEDEKKLRKHYYAAGWQNEFGAWEVRNKYFKGCLGQKGITIIEDSMEKVAIFEGYLNYLSWLADHPNDSA